jgi:hypothetical protein
MSKLLIGTTEVDIYTVGIYRDFRNLKTQGLKAFWFWFSRSWMRKSYWNGYLAESGNKDRCGTGWTKRGALRSWKKIPER